MDEKEETSINVFDQFVYDQLQIDICSNANCV